eukprot:TRINITY_DN8528_c0_g1_i30.p1 TRINITY_DN8528_c0_g1~~TRINITY_DN8528_c0_g1_i30.p1  ORF type:complete len:406 (-),score=107.63 TRINITY_DN8528_c0_g1_i30:80-1297(-)
MQRNNGSGRSYEESLSGKRLRSDQSSAPQSTTHVRPYEELNKKYIADGFNQNTLQYLKRMSNSSKSNRALMVVPGYPRSELFSILLYVCKLLHMNELETLQWSLCAESEHIDWSRKDLSQSIILLLTGFQAKQFFNSKQLTEVYYEKISMLHSGFPTWLQTWLEDDKAVVGFSPEAFNSQYTAYREAKQTDKAQKNPESLDYNQVVSELLTISAHNITEIPVMPQSKDTSRTVEAPKGSLQIIVPEAAAPKPAASPAPEQRPKPDEPSQSHIASFFDMQLEELDTPRIALSFGRADSLNRFGDYPSMNSRGNSAFMPLNFGDEPGMSKMWGSIGLSISRPPTLLGDSNKLLQFSSQDPEEKKEETEIERHKNGGTTSIEQLVAKEYFPDATIYNSGHNGYADRKG